eukprot:1317986-Alexandrium_andersonii.AAC.1
MEQPEDSMHAMPCDAGRLVLPERLRRARHALGPADERALRRCVPESRSAGLPVAFPDCRDPSSAGV